jgi:hypothetical protein
MPLSDADLRSLIAGRPFGPGTVYEGGDEAAIEGFLRGVVAGLARSALVEVEADFGHYGSGYASYVDVFCPKRGGRSTAVVNGVRWIDGLVIYLSRLAPVAAFGPSQRTRHRTGGSYDYLDAGKVGVLPPGDWSAEAKEVRAKLAGRYGFALLGQDELSRPLPLNADIATALADRPYRVFDAVFYWED